MRLRRHLALLLQVLLVLVASLLGIVTNYATEAEDAPAWLNVLQQVAAPGIGVLIVLLVVGHVAAYRLESPPRLGAHGTRHGPRIPGSTPTPRTRPRCSSAARHR